MSLPLVREDLTQKILKRLVGLAHTHQYPLQQSMGLGAFYESLDEMGAIVEMDDNKREMKITFGLYSPFLGEGFSYTTSVNYDEILNGSGNFPRGSIGSLHDSSKNLFDISPENIPIDKRAEIELYGKQVKKNSRLIVELEAPYSPSFQQASWRGIFEKMHSRNINLINRRVEIEIQKRRENAFLARTLQGENGITGRAIERILDREDLTFYEKSRVLYFDETNTPEDIASPTVLINRDWSRFGSSKFPSPITFEDFFWGLFLERLHQMKGYELSFENEFGAQQHLVYHKENGLKKGKEMSWGADYSREYVPD